jgi:hypothetical protein
MAMLAAPSQQHVRRGKDKTPEKGAPTKTADQVSAKTAHPPYVLSRVQEGPPPENPHTVPATIHSELAGCKMETPNPFAILCENYASSV